MAHGCCDGFGGSLLTATIYLNVVNVSSGPYFCDGLLRPWEQTQVTWNQATTSSA
jgi:hypothetical protein